MVLRGIMVALALSTSNGAIAATATAPVPPAVPDASFGSADLFHLRAVGDPQLSPDGRTTLFTVQYSDRIGAPYSRIWTADLSSGLSRPWGGGDGVEGSTPRWSP